MSWMKPVPVSLASDPGLSALVTACADRDNASEDPRSLWPGRPHS